MLNYSPFPSSLISYSCMLPWWSLRSAADPVDRGTDVATRLTSMPLKLKPPTGFKSDLKLAGIEDENSQVPRQIKTLTRVLSSNLSKQELRSELITPPKQSRKAPTPRQQVRAPPIEGVANGTSTGPIKPASPPSPLPLPPKKRISLWLLCMAMNSVPSIVSSVTIHPTRHLSFIVILGMT